MIRLSGSLVAACMAMASALAAPAQQDKSDLDVTTRAATITVTIEKELKTYPGLPVDLRAEAKRFVAKARAESDEEYKTNREWFLDEGRLRCWTYERAYNFRSLVANRYVSIVRNDGTYTGGAHPNSRAETILWDSAQKKRISIRPFFTEMADNGPTMTALARLVRRAVAAAKIERLASRRREERSASHRGGDG
jgi:hypothetical protein